MPLPKSKLKVIGIDPSLRNWGLAIATLNLGTKKLTLDKLSVVNPVLPSGKRVRQNSLDLESAFQLYKETIIATKGANAVFIEVPVGSQSARAMASYGICVGVLGALRATGIPFFEVTPTEVKLAGPGMKTATKKQMISWALHQHPEGNWPTYTQHNKILVSEAKAEHMADAVASIYAGMASNSFQQLLAMLPTQSKDENDN
jgi:Holliday junction resolvasome RuvABC endonuclease subunit